MRVAIVKYNAGNVRSVANALERIGVEYCITDDARELLSAERVIVPGVGEASSAMAYLRERELEATLRRVEAPLLGICLGLQLLCDSSAENDARCLGVIPGRVERFTLAPKVPHMGWSKISVSTHPLFAGVPVDSYVYFVHSYRLSVTPNTIATCSYGETFSAATAHKNFMGVQFHPEKSAAVGERILRNFVEFQV